MHGTECEGVVYMLDVLGEAMHALRETITQQ